MTSQAIEVTRSLLINVIISYIRIYILAKWILDRYVARGGNMIYIKFSKEHRHHSLEYD